MRQRFIGAVNVAEIGFGACLLSNEGRPDEAQALATVHAALDAGATLVDSADAYALSEEDFGHNELFVRRALSSYGPGAADVLVATKGGHTRLGTTWGLNGDPGYLKQACRQSLRRLGVESIGLYQLHWPDPAVPYAESIGALRDLLDEGLIEMAGISNANCAQIALAIDILGGRLASVQNELSISVRSSEAELALCARRGIAFLAYQPLGGSAAAAGLGVRHRALQEIADRHGVSPHRVAIAWLLAKAPNVIPIPGARRPATIVDSLEATDVRLAPEEIERLERA